MASSMSAEHQELLCMTRPDFFAHINNPNSLTTPFDKVTVGTAINRQLSQGEPEILLPQQELDEADYSGVYGIPGDKVDDTDASLAEAVAREVQGEGQIVVSLIVNALSYLVEVENGKGECQTIQVES
ncbi:hypothetical protein BJ170DRAFT_161250 [Xylariales sp. AK1849]|nr:hypothetical protein BJ170DRAFT_161250 [Xylariales sp. AK1849]